MTPARWQQVKQIFDAAIGRAPDERARLLDEVCVNDETLRREVEMLLASHEHAASFMETPAVAKMAQVLITDAAPTLAAGASVGHYRIVKPLGAGGMGEVYLAEDVRLGRQVALKVLPAMVLADGDTRRRFAQEARAASTLNHPHIIAIYDVALEDEAGVTNFIAMEYVAGQSLGDKLNGAPLAAAEVVVIAAQIADALDAAHARGIIHRDIKPANIMLTERGQVKVLDFGLAKLTTNIPSASSDIVTQPQTAMGIVLGTVSYMSPEQALGQKMDTRTDIFSFGVVLYEMLTGRRPFDGDTAPDTIDRIAHAQPEAIARFNYDAPPELERITRKCLEKERARRYQTARELVIDLQNLQRDHSAQTDGRDSLQDKTRRSEIAAPHVATASSSMSRRFFAAWSARLGGALLLAALVFAAFYFSTRRAVINSLAVMPFVNASGNPDVEYLSDGMTESLISSLSQLPKLSIKARSSVFRYKGKEVAPPQVGRELGVQAILMGRVVQRGNDLTLHVELVDAQTETVLWSEDYNRQMTNLISLQSEIAREVSEKLRLRLTSTEQQRLTKQGTQNTEAHLAYLRGWFYWNKGLAPGFEKSREYFQQAIDLDPTYALAYSGLGGYYAFASTVGLLPPNENWPKAEAASNKALALDDTLADTYNLLAAVKLYYYRDWPAAERYFRRGIELNPNSAEIHAHYAGSLMSFGRNEEALAEVQRSVELDPLSPRFNYSWGRTLFFMRQYDRAIDQFRKTLELDPNSVPAYELLGDAYEQKGMQREAVAEWGKALTLRGAGEQAANLERTYAASGFEAAVRALAQEQLAKLNERMKRGEYVSANEYVTAYTRLGDKEQAFAWLDKAVQERNGFVFMVKVNPIYDQLRADPRFQALLRRVGLPQ